MTEPPGRRNNFDRVEGRDGAGYKGSMAADSPGFSHVLVLADEAATVRFGARIAAGLKAGDAIALTGDLGAGKTTLARAILKALGVDERVPSPTFTLVQSYETKGLTVRHYDLYRLEDPREMDELGLDEALEEGAALIEWPERAGTRLPREMLYINLEQAGADARHVGIHGPSRWAEILP